MVEKGTITDLMNEEQLRKYVFDRKLHPEEIFQNLQADTLEKIVIHNAFRTGEVEESLKDSIKYTPKKSTEYHFYVPKDKALHVINTRGDIRFERDKDQYWAFRKILGRDIAVEIHHYKKQQKHASRRFRDIAFELVDQVFADIDISAVEKEGKIHVIFGPHDSLSTNDVSEIFSSENDFLNYRLLKIGGQTVVNFDYVFADQAKNVLEQFFLISNDYFSELDVNIFHYGKIGVLHRESDIGSIWVPTGALDEKKLLDGDATIYPVNNQLESNKTINKLFSEIVGEDVYSGTTLNTASILRQKRDSLINAYDAGAEVIDMEWLSMASYHNTYPRIGKIHYFFAGVCSDKPLEGKTLADTPYPKQEERNIANAFKEIIRNKTY